MNDSSNDDSDCYDPDGHNHLAPSRGFSDDPAWLITPDLLNAPHIQHRFKQPRRQLTPYGLYISSHIALEGPYVEPSPSPSPTSSVRGESPVDRGPVFSHANHQLPTPSTLDALSRSSTWTNGTDFSNDHYATTRVQKSMKKRASMQMKRPMKTTCSPKKKTRRDGRSQGGIRKTTRRRNTHSMTTRSKGQVQRNIR